MQPFDSGDHKWSTQLGAGCNVMEVSLNIHCTGTHTETVGHLTNKPVHIRDVLTDALIPAGLITVTPTEFGRGSGTYHVTVGSSELVIDRLRLEQCLQAVEYKDITALIVRTLPNVERKLSRRYSQHPAAFFTHESMEFIRELNIRHLVVDLPSVDRADDDGILANHRIFWGLDLETKVIPAIPSTRTITEMAYIPDDIPDGLFFLNLQVPGFMLDAAPSRPLICRAVR